MLHLSHSLHHNSRLLASQLSSRSKNVLECLGAPQSTQEHQKRAW